MISLIRWRKIITTKLNFFHSNEINITALLPGVDPGFTLGGGAPLRNDVTDRRGKRNLTANTKKKASYQGVGGMRTPCT